MQTDFVFFKDPGNPLTLEHLGFPTDSYHNLGRTAASASGFVLQAGAAHSVRLAHWWVAAQFDGGSLQLMCQTPGYHDEQELASITDARASPITLGKYITPWFNEILSGGREKFFLVRGMGRVRLFSATLSIAW